MAEAETKLARLADWVRTNMDRQGAFLKFHLYSFARDNGIERSALDFIYRCRKMGTIRDVNKRIEVLVPRGSSLAQFYKDLLKIQEEPVLKGKPKPPTRKKKESEEKKKELLKEPLSEKEKATTKSIPRTEPPREVPGLVNAIAQRLEDRFKRMDDTIASINSLVEHRIDDLETKVSVVIVKELEKRIHQLEIQLDEFRAKAEAFDLIKRDAWEVIQALEIVEREREDMKKVLKKFL